MKHRETGKEYAAKLVKNVMGSKQHARMVARELIILRKLSKVKSNIFTTKLRDVLVPKDDYSSIFFIMDYESNDLKKLLQNDEVKFDQEHALIILYNILCGLNFLHSANIIHRDIKPGNILINSNCQIKICDFGMARTMSLATGDKTSDEKDLDKKGKHARKLTQ